MITLNVENYGAINKANIEIKKISILTGDNNSGVHELTSLYRDFLSVKGWPSNLDHDIKLNNVSIEYKTPNHKVEIAPGFSSVDYERPEKNKVIFIDTTHRTFIDGRYNKTISELIRVGKKHQDQNDINNLFLIIKGIIHSPDQGFSVIIKSPETNLFYKRVLDLMELLALAAYANENNSITIQTNSPYILSWAESTIMRGLTPKGKPSIKQEDITVYEMKLGKTYPITKDKSNASHKTVINTILDGIASKLYKIRKIIRKSKGSKRSK